VRPLGAEHYGAERLGAANAKAERVVREEWRSRRWRQTDLAQRAQGDLGKVRIAFRLRAETGVTVQWIAARLGMGTVSSVNSRRYRWREATLK
jgi:hypothetical protein